MQKPNFFLDNDDLEFHLKKRLDLKSLYEWLPKEAKEAVGATDFDSYLKSWTDVMEACGEISAVIAQNAKKVEQEELVLEKGEVQFGPVMLGNLKLLKDFGISALSISPEYGGMSSPYVFDMIGAEVLNRACPSTMINSSWYGNIAHIIDVYGSEELKQEYLPKIASGDFSGNMALTEADAGSDLANLKTYAVQESDGTWRIFGSKRFISNGQGEISLVLAKNKKNAHGLDKLNLFLCPRQIDGHDNIRITKLEEKLGLHGAPTCELQYDGAKAWLLGEDGKGYRYMLRLMNDSRIGVGFQGIGLMEATWRQARDYAAVRKSWGKPIAHHELIAEKLLDLEVELKATRSLGYQAALCRSLIYSGEHYLKTCPADEKVQVQKKIAVYEKRLRNLTPLLKYWVGEKSVEHARTSLQIFGGYGYSAEYSAEWWLRESVIYALYEGTSQMQALMCLKDAIKDVISHPANFVQTFLGSSYRVFMARNPLHRKLNIIQQTVQKSIVSILIKLMKVNLHASLSETSKTDLQKMFKILKTEFVKFENLQPALLHAERLCEMKCYESLMETLIEDAKIDPSRRWIAERFAHVAIPRVKLLKTRIELDDSVLMERLKSYEDKDKKGFAKAFTGT